MPCPYLAAAGRYHQCNPRPNNLGTDIVYVPAEICEPRPYCGVVVRDPDQNQPLPRAL